MFEHRLCQALTSRVISLNQPFSCFDFIEGMFGSGQNAIHRCFSLARSFETQTLVLEELDPLGEGIILAENKELQIRYPEYKSQYLSRLSFWQKEIKSIEDLTMDDNESLVGYAIIKNDCIPKHDATHVFEAVFRKYSHKHNCVRKGQSFDVRVGNSIFSAQGALFAQQNGISKCCAHVALYTILCNNFPDKEPSFAQMTQIVNGLHKESLDLDPYEIRKILDFYGLEYHDIYYPSPEEQECIENKDDLLIPFNKLIYAGIESGAGALAGFMLSKGGGHIIPFWGHTFNKDTWVSDAELFYFKTGEIAYAPSENWTSSFIGHDDNFGPNLCVPKLYLTKKQVNYVVEIFRPGVKFSGAKAEIAAYQLFYSILQFIKRNPNINKWTYRAYLAFISKRIVLRTVSLEKSEYLESLKNLKDWENNSEDEKIIDFLAEHLPEYIWLTEFSLPQLFPANERKIGEIILDATQYLDSNNSQAVFLAARFPSNWYFPNEDGTFLSISSTLVSHTPNFC